MNVETTAGPRRPPAAAQPRALTLILSPFLFLIGLFRGRGRRRSGPAQPGRARIPTGANGSNPDGSGTPVTGGWPPPK
ncbi:MAG: hypothetical protein QOJ16_1002 [Acidobacteriota bacterium]|jgi:hypothetical protein|nr:hypothetical protein [Acidobacteriota bacterium]